MKGVTVLGRWGVVLVAALWFMAPGTGRAATIPIDNLNVDAVSVTIAVDGDGTYSFSTSLTPITVTMGAYQDPIVELTAGSSSVAVYSTDAYGEPAPSGSVETSLGGIDVDFSSLRARVVLPSGSFDMALWPLVNPPSGGTYDSATNSYTLDWIDGFSVMLYTTGGTQTITGTTTVQLSGTVTLVPLPAALWLMLGGLAGLGLFGRQRTAH